MEPADVGRGKFQLSPLPCFLLKLDASVQQEQGSLLLLHLHDVGLPTAAWRKGAVLGPMSGLAVVEASVIPGRLALTGDAAIDTSLHLGSFLLLATARTPATFL